MKEDKVTLTFTQDEIRNMLLPLYEFYIFEYEDIDNVKRLHGQMRLYGRLLAAAGLEEEDEE